MKKYLLLILFVLIFSPTCLSQRSRAHDYNQMLSQTELKDIIISLADDRTQGRASGTAGSIIAAEAIRYSFRSSGLRPYNQDKFFTQSFTYDTLVMRNIIGMIPSNNQSDEYLILCAHYDHLGTLHDRIYNGADANASGVAVLLTLAKMISKMSSTEKNLNKNIIFAAFDGKEFNMAGSEYFVKNLTIARRKIKNVLVMDMIGSNLIPHSNEYIIILGDRFITTEQKNTIKRLNAENNINLALDFSFGESREFSQLLYAISDNFVFARRGIAAMLFTSGFHQHTLKPSDDESIIDYPSLEKRTQLIFNFVRHLATK